LKHRQVIQAERAGEKGKKGKTFRGKVTHGTQNTGTVVESFDQSLESIYTKKPTAPRGKTVESGPEKRRSRGPFKDPREWENSLVERVQETLDWGIEEEKKKPCTVGLGGRYSLTKRIVTGERAHQIESTH